MSTDTLTAPEVKIDGDELSVHFDRFNLPTYQLFLRCKALPEMQVEYAKEEETYTIKAPARYAGMLGVEYKAEERGMLPFPKWMYDDQEWIVRRALNVKRFAVWAGCGNGKTYILTEFCRQVNHITSGRSLIVTRNEIIPQFMEMIQAMYGDTQTIVRLNHRDEMKDWCRNGPGDLAITNYEKFNHKTAQDQIVNEIRHLSAICLDESSRLAQGAGRQKWAIIKSSRGVPYKLSATATPAPNDAIEFASQASFLEKMKTENDVIWTFFAKNTQGEWTVKRHAREAFYNWMAAWSIYLMDPRRFGWRKEKWVEVPPAVVIRHDIDITPEQQEYVGKLCQDKHGQMSLVDQTSKGIVVRSKLSQVAKGFIYHQHKGKRTAHLIPSMKPEFVARLARDEVAAGLQTLVWIVFDSEGDIIGEELRKIGQPFDLVVGKVKDHERIAILERFRKGQCPLLITRSDMCGFGQNFQACRSMIYSGWTDSYVSWYQSRKRAERQGQTYSVRIHIPVIPALESDVLENLLIKGEHHLSMIEQMESQYIRIIQEERKAINA